MGMKKKKALINSLQISLLYDHIMADMLGLVSLFNLAVFAADIPYLVECF